jgi:hypothetical protein
LTADLDQLRDACRRVAGRARSIRIDLPAIPSYAAAVAPAIAAQQVEPPDPEATWASESAEERAAFWLTLDAINFGSGWFPTIKKRPGRSGYFTVAIGVRERFAARGPWTASSLAEMSTAEVAAALDQDPAHELMGLYARSLNDLGWHVQTDFGGRFAAVPGAAHGSAVTLATMLGSWECFADSSTYDGIEVPFLKRAQIAAADLQDAGVAHFADLALLTMFADNLVPHVLHCDGILVYNRELEQRIERGDLLEHGSPEEVELRACALHAVELIVAELPGTTAADVDRTLWNRGQHSAYKAAPRHRSRCTAY